MALRAHVRKNGHREENKMEILGSEIITKYNNLFLSIFIFAIAMIIATMYILTYSDISIKGKIVAIILSIILIVLVFFFPPSIKTGDIKYTVEITDAAKYKELIDNGYSLERLYDTKEIYEIIGPPFN